MVNVLKIDVESMLHALVRRHRSLTADELIYYYYLTNLNKHDNHVKDDNHESEK
ncbi:hypothetical protein WBG78_05000 [Chryseolinea sp. T2]|uniref:hypothetical protein n=1 Tax=Chryseolinea sp. T2 TaxID=3129255 RepID=UPI003077637B